MAFARVTVCVCVGGRHKAGGGAPLSGEGGGGGHLPQMPPISLTCARFANKIIDDIRDTVALENFYSIFYSICRFLGIIAERVILHTA